MPRRGTYALRWDRVIGRDELKAALAGGMLETRYQPIVRLDTGAPVALEVLARLNHPALGTVLPERFVPLIEDAGLAAELIEHVAGSAFADMAGAAVASLGLSFGLNLPLEVLLVPAALERLDAQRRAAGIGVGRVVIELTESQPVTDLPRLRRATERVREAGYRMVIDDVSPSLPFVAELMELPFTGLKLDKKLVQGMGHRSGARSFVADTIATASRRGLTVIAEGVEELGTWRRLRAMGAHLAQGFLVAHPLTAVALPGWVAGWRAPA
ncbi:MAG TPA: EAL domain-containing protein [Acetobacteraceae bacterium]|nr:EAL domain-containing protein [Acetobacteraceae bacterium]